MDVVSTLRTLGGVTSMRILVKVTSRRKVRAALAAGLVERSGRTIVLPEVQKHYRAALDFTAVLSHLSAAQHWGWPVKSPPDQAWITVRRNRKVAKDVAGRLHAVYADLPEDEVVDHVTTPLRTVLDCAKRLPFDEALAVADSALRSRMVDKLELMAAASRVQGRGRLTCLRVAQQATPLAANPFESVLRSIVLVFPELDVEPQGRIEARDLILHPDLVDRANRMVFEADSHEFHTSKPAHDLDCERFTALGVCGWLVIRFSWEQVMLRPDYVRRVLAELAGIVRKRSLQRA